MEGSPIGRSRSVSNRTGQGPRMTCTAEEHFAAEDGLGVDLCHTVQVVHLP